MTQGRRTIIYIRNLCCLDWPRSPWCAEQTKKILSSKCKYSNNPLIKIFLAWPVFWVLDASEPWFPVNRYQYTSHIPSPSPITLSKKKNKGSPPLLKTLRVCFKTAFKTCHCEGETKYIILQTPCPILPDILINWHLFTDTLLICSCKEGASIFNQT